MQAAVTFSPLRVSIFCAACPQRAKVEAGETGVRLKEALPDHQGPGGSQDGVTFTWEAGGLFHPGVYLGASLPT